jgi:hypothetical protein
VSHTNTRIMHRLAMVLMTITLTVLGDGVSHNEAHQAPCHRLHNHTTAGMPSFTPVCPQKTRKGFSIPNRPRPTRRAVK